MPCPSCGKPTAPGAITCVHCHALLTQPHTGAQPAGSSQDRQIPVTPVEPVQPVPVPKNKRSGWKILLIVIGLFVGGLIIIPLMLGVVLGTVSTAREKGVDAKRVLDIKRIQLALELYFDKYGSYPEALSSLDPNDMPSGMPLEGTDGNTYPYIRCTPETYHLAAVLSEDSTALAEDADLSPICAGDAIDGRDQEGCAPGAPGHCYDEAVTLTAATGTDSGI